MATSEPLRVLVTGANRGLGLSLVKNYLSRGAQVISWCRKPSEELKNLKGTKIMEGVDVTNLAAVREAAACLDAPIDILINNAGILSEEYLDSLDFDSMMQQYDVNTLGPLRVVSSCLPKLHDGSKVVMISSGWGSIGAGGSGPYGYRVSKAALNMVVKSLSVDLQAKGVIVSGQSQGNSAWLDSVLFVRQVAALCPGLVDTDLNLWGGGKTPDDAAENIIERIVKLEKAGTGSFLGTRSNIIPW